MFEIKHKNVMPENNKIFAWNGSINRLDFALNILILHGILLVFSIAYFFFVALAGFMNVSTLVQSLIYLYMFIMVIFTVIFYSNIVRRINSFTGDYAILCNAIFISGLILMFFFNLKLYLLIMLILLCTPESNRKEKIQNKIKYGTCLILNLMLFIIKFYFLHILGL